MFPARRTALVMLLAALTAFFAAPGAALAWTEARPSGLVTELTLDHDGGATVALRIRWTVLGGRMHEFDVTELPTDLTLIEASAVAGNGSAVPVTTHATSQGRLAVSFGDETRGVRRGTVDVLLRYTTSLRALGAIRMAGSEAVVEVSTVPWARGIEGAELRVAIPASVRRAQWIADETPGVEASTSTELSRDVVHAVRRQLPASERWIARIAVDPAVFPWLSSGVAHRPAVIRKARPAYDLAALVAGLAALFLVGFAKVLSRVAPGGDGGGGRRLPILTAAYCGVFAQALHVLHVPFALLAGTLLLVGAAIARLPSSRVRASAVLARVTPRTVSEKDLVAASPLRHARLRHVAILAALVASIAVVVASVQGLAWASVLAADLALASLVWVAWSSRVDPLPDAAVLLPLGATLRSIAKKSGRARTAWRVRGDLGRGGSLTLRVVPLPGWRHVRGVRAVECAVRDERSPFGASLSPELVVRFDAGSPMERSLRLLAARVGAVIATPDGDALTYRVTLLGADADVALVALKDLTRELFVKAPATGSSERSLGAVVGEGATAQ